MITKILNLFYDFSCSDEWPLHCLEWRVNQKQLTNVSIEFLNENVLGIKILFFVISFLNSFLVVEVKLPRQPMEVDQNKANCSC